MLPRSYSRTKPGAIWFHAVSVGEVASSISLIRNMRTEQPRVPIYLSTSTAAGRQTALCQASELVNGIFYAPLDYMSCARRCFRAIRPALLVVFETEIWPNLYRGAHEAGAGLAIVNGRISNRAWPRYRAWRWFFCQVLHMADLIFPQSPIDRQRYLDLGVPESKFGGNANLKYDASSPASSPLSLSKFNSSQIWIAASTVGPDERGSLHKHTVDEDDLVIAAFQKLALEFPRLLLILAPRQPSRFNEVARKLEDARVPFLRRTALQSNPDLVLARPGVLLLDTIGELAALYASANAVFVGGSIAPRGGHNIIEPASAAAPIIIGPHMHNFESITQDFLEANAIIQITREEELLPAVRDLLANDTRAKELGLRAQQLVNARRGAVHYIAHRLWQIYFASTPRPAHNLISRLLLGGLAHLWAWGGEGKRRTGVQLSYLVRPLPVPVISIGGITVGGAGKTPFTNYLAARLRQREHSPAILTRGYRRQSPAKDIILPPGTAIPAAFTGDEAQIFLRSGYAPLGIGANRHECAQILLRQFPETNVLLLDDGFQHARLQRSLDVVLIDGLNPFGHENVIPLGRLREPLHALARADAFVVTRAENELRFDAINSRLHALNPHAPVFRTRLVDRCWRDLDSACVPAPRDRPVAAFCGLGNPDSYWRTLESLGLQVVFHWSFDDHHAYKPFELKRIAHHALCYGAEVLVTTEKDLINCPPHLERVIAPLQLYWLEIELQLDDEPRFLSFIERVIRKRGAPGSLLRSVN